eukprot:TRINITY_DN2657_c0_g2_i1.p1 TRINITY_DN2657_c0_g2~~TRINITY_DN2657_c0_g2_i1.p1  ORF type:complete len:1449 (-),score=523.30 TRINITY_DN2657_c0_g2_i1:64-4410(-)
MKKNASTSGGGWSGKGGKGTQEKKKTQRNDAERTKLDHYLFIGGIGPLEEKDFHEHWTNDGLKYIDVMKPTSHCVAVFQNSATVRGLVEKKYESIKGRICVTQPYFVYNDDESYFAREKHRIDEELHQLEESATPLSPNSTATQKPTGIKVTEERGKLPSQLVPGGRYEFQLRIKNSTATPRFVSKVTAVPMRREFSFEIKPKSTSNDESHSTVTVKFSPKSFGSFKQLIYLQFDNKKLQVQHELQMVVNPPEEELKKLFASVPLQRIERGAEETSPRSVIHSTYFNEQNDSQPLEIYASQIEDYPLPLEVENNNNVNSKNKTNNNSTNLRENHRNRLHQLLWSEEAQEIKESKDLLEGVTIRNFDPNSDVQSISSYLSQKIAMSPSLFVLQFPFGSERKFENLQLRDLIYVRNPIQKNVEYEGRVEYYDRNNNPLFCLVSFSEQMQNIIPSTFQFQLRIAYKRSYKKTLHKAVDLLDVSLIWPESTLKPESTVKSGTTWAELANGKAKGVKPLERSLSEGNSQNNNRSSAENSSMRFQGGKKLSRKDLKLVDESVGNNEDQVTAILNVLNRTHGMIPFLLHGGYGCGKSKTLVEMINQIIEIDESNTVLVCTKSEESAKKFVRELSTKWNPSQLFRFQAHYNSFDPSEDLSQFSRYDEEKGIFVVPKAEELSAFKIVVANVSSVASLHGFGLEREHFTHILVDDAARMSEPEAVAAVSFGSQKKKTAIVLAGDDRQIGPITKIGGPTCKSMMERLASLSDVFGERTNPSPSFSIELKENYSNSSSIISFLSNQFYSGKLKGGDECLSEQTIITNWSEGACDPAFPFFFQSVEGKDDRDSDSPSSFFNLSEAFTILHILTQLLKKNNSGVSENEVGVVTSFPNQTVKISMLLKLHGFSQVKVGILDDFQEDEKKLILVSTVRSGVKHLPLDRRYSLGFLQDADRKLNFCLSKSLSACIVVGDPFILSQDSTWRSFFEYLQTNKAYFGPIITSESRKTELERREAMEEEQLNQEKSREESKDSDSSTHTALTSVGKSASMDSLSLSRSESSPFPALKSARSYGNASGFASPQAPIASPSKQPSSPSRNSPKTSAPTSNTPTPNSSVVGSLFPTELADIESFLPVSALHDEEDVLVMNEVRENISSHSVIGSSIIGGTNDSSTTNPPSNSKLDPFRKSESFNDRAFSNHFNSNGGENFNSRTQESSSFLHGNTMGRSNSIGSSYRDSNFGSFMRDESDAFGLNDFHLTPSELGIGELSHFSPIGQSSSLSASFPQDYMDQGSSPNSFNSPTPASYGTNGNASPAPLLNEDYEVLCQLENFDLLFFKKGLGVPPLHVSRKGGVLWIEISCFKIQPSIQRNGHSITMSFFKEEDRNHTLFSTGRVFLPNSKGLASSDSWIFERNNALQSQLVLSIPSYCNPAWVEVGVNTGSVVITMPPLRNQPYFSAGPSF